MTDPTIASWSRENDLLFQLRQLREENERLRTALEQQAEPPPEWPLIKNILAVFGLDAISFVAKWQAAQQQAEQIGWAVQGCSKMWRGEFAEIDAKAEAKRIGGTCVAFALYTAQREWAGLTDEDWGWVADKKETSLDTFAHGAAWASDQLKERNNG